MKQRTLGSLMGLVGLGWISGVGLSLCFSEAAGADPLDPNLDFAEQTPPRQLAQQFPNAEDLIPESGLEPGRDTRSGSSYIGIGGNLGAVGGSSVGKDGMIIYSKIGLTEFFSVRPAVTTNFTDDATFLLPATFDFAPIRIGRVGQSEIQLAPYIGAGMAVTTDADFGPMINGGIDVPLNRDFTATVGTNAGFIDDGDFGVFLGVGYNMGR
ncbi:hypothetical protein [Lyngbya confervoides]|uniref:Outer membrane protein beta-barrel domain-containing protein n=1 Tax=Lyngbya confervoides BDU141951 TaxID=1574623 RepID=A0ABD4SZU7_9CYAN|nr:hypothetical protein [Lyngbya confervoides]MCM1981675.1 hypothetical protein [Lyngbya confervoides BDU141951]